MSEPKLISPLLDNFDMGDPISCHDGVRCCPAMEKDSDKKYIVKIISIPASQVQLDALLLTGAYKSVDEAAAYFKDLAEQVTEEAAILKKLSALEGFLSYEKWQVTPMSRETGYQVYLLGEYRRTLEQHFRKKPMTHLGAVNLGLDLCAALAVCRHSGYIHVDLKPGNICIMDDKSYRVFDLGFVKLSGMKFASLPNKYISQYTAPEITDAFSSLNPTIDIYAAGLILYQAYNDGMLPFRGDRPNAEVFAPPAYADYEMAEIILKACAPNPEDRWQDPIQMGQALVSYMQRNGANDVPIIPVPQDDDLTNEAISSESAENADPLSDCDEVSDTDFIDLQETFLNGETTEEVPSEITAEQAPVLIPQELEESSDDSDLFADIAVPLVTEPAITTDEPLDPQLLSLLDSIDSIYVEPNAPEVSPADEKPKTEASAETWAEEESASDAEPEEQTANSTEPEALPAAEMQHDAEPVYTEDDFGNLTFLDISSCDETSPDNLTENIEYDEVSAEVSDILTYADELLAHPIPEPVVAPDPIEVPIPDPLPVIIEEPEPEPQNSEPGEEIPDFGVNRFPNREDRFPKPTDITQIADEEVNDGPSKNHKSIRKLITALICLLLICGLAILGFYYYQNHYLQPISITADGTEDSLIVYVSSGVDENKLTVFCADTYGNSLSSPVIDGKATFANLAPGSGYTVSVEITGFHRLTGNTSTAYSTPVQTNVVQFSGISGPEDGSVILSFAIDGPDSQQWSVRFTADGEETRSVDFTGHMITVVGLTIGKEYTFTLESDSSMYITGNYQLKWMAEKNIIAENLEIIGCDSSKLTATWNQPEGTEVESWSVRCYNDSGFDETITTADTEAIFTGLDHTKGYTVEVTAARMTVSARTFIGANAATVTGFSADTSNPEKMNLSWTTTHPLADGNWILLYSADGLEPHEVSCSSDNSAQIQPLIPGATYTFTLLTTTGSHVFNNTFEYRVGEAPKFSNYNVTSDHMEFNMCITPDVENWDRFDLDPADYTTTFAVGQKASFLIRVRHEYNPMSDNIVSMFVIRNASGDIVKMATSEQTWINMWYRGYCELDIPVMPDVAGNYTITVYFNGYFAGEREFTVTNS